MDYPDDRWFIKQKLEEHLLGRGIDITKVFTCLNPSHEDTHPSMSFDRERIKVHCFSCGADYDLLDVIGIEHRLTDPTDIFRTARELYPMPGASGDKVRIPSAPPCESHLPQVEKEDLREYFEVAHQRLRETGYAKKRGLSDKTAEIFQLGFDPAFEAGNGVQWQALIVPTSPSSFMARNADPDADKRERIRKKGSAPLFNLKALSEDRSVFIVEGEIDAMSMLEAGGAAVALGGISSWRKLAVYLGTHKPDHPVVLALDADQKGIQATFELARALDLAGVHYLKADIYGGCKDANEALLKDRDSFIKAVRSIELVGQSADDLPKAEYLKTSVAGLLDDFIKGEGGSVESPAIPTGFFTLDLALGGGLHTGLYIIGASSSLGKTTLVSQIADQVARNSKDIIFFSLEMTLLEMIAKSISRHLLDLCKKRNLSCTTYAKTSRQLLDGEWRSSGTEQEKQLIKEAVDEYGSYAIRIYMPKVNGGIGLGAVRQSVFSHIKFTGNHPMLVVDYLQILAPNSEQASDKQNMDKAVLELKKISSDFNIPVVCISSLNRQSYSSEVSMESFKESGAIEYSSDVLIGLQMKGTGEKNFNIDKAKREYPRRVELKIIKQRNGASGDSIDLNYYPDYNYFEEAQDGCRDNPETKEHSNQKHGPCARRAKT